MHEPREEVEEVQQFGNLDAAVDQLVFARSKEKKDKMKGDSAEGQRRSGGQNQGGARFNKLPIVSRNHDRECFSRSLSKTKN